MIWRCSGLFTLAGIALHALSAEGSAATCTLASKLCFSVIILNAYQILFKLRSLYLANDLLLLYLLVVWWRHWRGLSLWLRLSPWRVLYDSLLVIHSWIHTHYVWGANMVASTAYLLLLFLILSITRTVVGDSDYQVVNKLVLGLLPGIFCHFLASNNCSSRGWRNSRSTSPKTNAICSFNTLSWLLLIFRVLSNLCIWETLTSLLAS